MIHLKFFLFFTILLTWGPTNILHARAPANNPCQQLEINTRLIERLRRLIQRNLQARQTFTSATANIKISSNLIMFDAKLQKYLAIEEGLKEQCAQTT
jgi:hypothetical protein